MIYLMFVLHVGSHRSGWRRGGGAQRPSPPEAAGSVESDLGALLSFPRQYGYGRSRRGQCSFRIHLPLESGQLCTVVFMLYLLDQIQAL
jgi:hypothetical protein